MTISSYAWATAHNVALVSLTNVETDLTSYMNGYQVAPRSQPVDPWPIETDTLDGMEHGDGSVNHVWIFDVLTVTAFKHILDTYLYTSSAYVKSKAITIYTRRHDLGDYARYNAYIVYPKIGKDYQYQRGAIVDLNLRFRRLIAL